MLKRRYRAPFKKMMCPSCDVEMKLINYDNIDKLIWKCNKKACNKKKISIRKGSFFYKSHLSFTQLLSLIYEWSRDSSTKNIMLDCSITKRICIDWCRYLRDICVYYAYDFPNMIGGPEYIVEFDESVSSKRKYNRGRLLKTEWMVAGKCRQTGDFFIEKVPNRNAETLREIISRRIYPGTTIITDCWRGYTNLDQIGMHHYTINHSQNFVDPIVPYMHTQNVENLWKCVKDFLKKKGSNRIYCRNAIQIKLPKYDKESI